MSKKQKGPQSKPSREEVTASFAAMGNDIFRLQLVLSWVTDLLVSKNVFTADEFKAFLDAKAAEFQAAQNPPNPRPRSSKWVPLPKPR